MILILSYKVGAALAITGPVSLMASDQPTTRDSLGILNSLINKYKYLLIQAFLSLRTPEQGFPGGAVVESLPADAGDAGSSPGLGRSHMPWSDWAREPQLLSLRVWSLCSATGEAAMVRGPRTAMKSGPRLPQLEKALAQKRRPDIAINQSINQ